MRAHTIAVLALIGMMMSSSVPWAASTAATGIESVAQAAVFLRVERIRKHRMYLSTGSGIFIHPNGYILADWSSVADQVTATNPSGSRAIIAPIQKISVVIESGSSTERVLPAEIVARDPSRGLAMLKVDYRPTAFVKPKYGGETGVGEKVWIAGFFCRELTALDPNVLRTEAPNPMVAIGSGSILAIDREDGRLLQYLQLDPTLDRSVCGGAIVDPLARLVGFIDSGSLPCRSRCFGVASSVVTDFVNRNAVSTSFWPPMALGSKRPIQVTVKPTLVDLDGAEGWVEVSRADAVVATFSLERTARGLETAIELPHTSPDDSRSPAVAVAVIVNSPTVGAPIRQDFSVGANSNVPSTVVIDTIPSRQTEMASESRGPAAGRVGQVPEGSGPARSLSDLAGSLKLRESDSGAIVIDDSMVGKAIQDEGSAHGFSPGRYERIRDPETRRLVQEYDRVSREIERLNRENAEMLDGSVFEELEYGQRYSEEVLGLMAYKQILAVSMADRGVRWCGEIEVYFVADGNTAAYPCQGVILTM